MQKIYLPGILSGIIVLLLALAGCGIEEAEISGPREGFGSYCDLDSGSATGTDGGGDPLSGTQWYLGRLSVPQVWQDFTGEGIQIGIVDDGLEIEHEDLRENIATNKSLNVISQARISENDPRPADCNSGHGTSVAGIIAATADNGLGIKGIAHGAKIFGVNYLGDSTDDNLFKSLTRELNKTAISSNSWGGIRFTRLRSRVSEALKIVINRGLTAGFGGKGISYVFAAGNARTVANDVPIEGLVIGDTPPADRPYADLATYEGLLNHPGVIPVCSVGRDDKVASYSNPGANLWVCGASNSGRSPDVEELENLSSDEERLQFILEHVGIPTTDLSGNAGYNQMLNPSVVMACTPTGDPDQPFIIGDCFNFDGPHPNATQATGGVAKSFNYHRFFTGTSAAAPTVSGIIALMRQANPELTWRDVKLILAETAEQVDLSGTHFGIGWQSSGIALNDPLVRYTHHHDYGFGLVNALAAVNLARAWTPVGVEMQEVSVAAPAASSGEFSFTVNTGNNGGINFIEFIQVEMQGDYSNLGDMTITLVSPNGVQSRLANPHSCLNFFPNPEMPIRVTDCADLKESFTFGTAAHLGENPNGTPNGLWRLRVTGGGQDSSGSATLTIYGHTRS